MPIVLKYKNAGRYDRIPIQQTRESKLNTGKYYCTGQALTISMVEITANSAEEAEAVMQRFVDKIAEVMKDELRWDEADWTIEENILNEATGEWESQEVAIVMDEDTAEYYKRVKMTHLEQVEEFGDCICDNDKGHMAEGCPPATE